MPMLLKVLCLFIACKKESLAISEQLEDSLDKLQIQPRGAFGRLLFFPFPLEHYVFTTHCICHVKSDY